MIIERKTKNDEDSKLWHIFLFTFLIRLAILRCTISIPFDIFHESILCTDFQNQKQMIFWTPQSTWSSPWCTWQCSLEGTEWWPPVWWEIPRWRSPCPAWRLWWYSLRWMPAPTPDIWDLQQCLEILTVGTMSWLWRQWAQKRINLQ